jgi:energy-coupling factor transporter ATP-binding protein EcfA2
VKAARDATRAAGLVPNGSETSTSAGSERSSRGRGLRALNRRLRAQSGKAEVEGSERSSAGRGFARNGRGRRGPEPSIRVDGLWYEVKDGPAVLRGVDLALPPGETVALMGRNGAGKSTLLRLVKGLIAPTRGRIERSGDVALLLQNPGDYLVHEHAGDEVGAHGLAHAGLGDRAAAHPRDLSGGERQRLALEVVLDGVEPAVVCLDEPTRGMDRAHKDALAARLGALAAAGAAVVVATHDTEFAARFAKRVVLMGQGVVIADAPTAEVLAGGWQFATDTARILGEEAGALTPEDGAELLQRELVR